MNRLVLFLIGIVLVGVAGFALVWFGVGRELQPVAARTLIELRDGDAQQVFDRAHESFRAGREVADLAAYWAWWGERLGRFVEILARRGVGVSTRNGETRKTLSLEVGFMKGKARADFEFVDADPEPLLSHLRLSRLDEGEGSRDDREQLAERARELLGRYDERDWIGVYAGLSSSLQQAWPPRTIAQQLAGIHAAHGKVSDLRLAETHEEGDDLVVQFFDVTYERGTGTAKVSQRYADGRWHVVGFVLDGPR